LNSIGINDPINEGLSQNFPNPFDESTIINYAIAGNQHVKIEVFNVIGEKISTLVDETLTPGYYSVPFTNEKFTDGIYYCRMITGEMNQVIKMISIK